MGTAKGNEWRKNPASDSSRNREKRNVTKSDSRGKNVSNEINAKNVNVVLKKKPGSKEKLLKINL